MIKISLQALVNHLLNEGHVFIMKKKNIPEENITIIDFFVAKSYPKFQVTYSNRDTMDRIVTDNRFALGETLVQYNTNISEIVACETKLYYNLLDIVNKSRPIQLKEDKRSFEVVCTVR